MPKPPEDFAKDILKIVAREDGAALYKSVVAAIRDRDFQLTTSTSVKLGGTD